jgi:hypothetical protein
MGLEWDQARYYCLLYQPRMVDGDDRGAIIGMNECQRKPKWSERTCPSAVLSITDPTVFGLGSNPGRRGRKPVTNLLSHGMAYRIHTNYKARIICNTCTLISNASRKVAGSRPDDVNDIYQFI